METSVANPASSKGVRVAKLQIAIVAHSPLATSFVKAAEEVCPGAQALLTPFDYQLGSDRDTALKTVYRKLVGKRAQRWLVISDLAWATSPGVVAMALGERLGSGTRLLCGLNMAMVLTAITMADCDVDIVWRACEQAGHDSVTSAVPGAGLRQ